MSTTPGYYLVLIRDNVEAVVDTRQQAEAARVDLIDKRPSSVDQIRIGWTPAVMHPKWTDPAYWERIEHIASWS